ncbi:MAG TPA: hypothetical protein VH415_05020 [Nitrososphaeraceae archaeon]|jgi:hypothetical protein
MTVRIDITVLIEKVNGGSHYDHFCNNELSLNKLKNGYDQRFHREGKIYVVL